MSRSRRLAAVLVLVLSPALAAGCARVVAGHGEPVAASGSTAGPSFPSPSSSATSTPSTDPSTVPSASATVATPTGTSPANVTCPTVSDTVAGIRYACITSGMTSHPVDGYSANVVLQTETTPQWFMAESSLKIDAFDAPSMTTAAQEEIESFVEDSFPAGSTGKATSEKTTTIDGKAAYLFDGLITVDKSTAEFKSLKATRDRIVAVAILRGDGTAAMLVLDVPDTQQTLWPRMDAIATSAQLI